MTLTRNAEWFRATGQMPVEPTPDLRQIAFYAGMQCEELAEKLAVFLPGSSLTADLQRLGDLFKTGRLDEQVGVALTNPANAKELLDGDIDLIWVSVGAAQAAGSNVSGAYDAVNSANWAKKFPDGTFHRHEVTGKVLKPEGWQAPDLTGFVHKNLR